MEDMNQKNSSSSSTSGVVPLFVVNKPPISPKPIGAWNRSPYSMNHGGAGCCGSKPHHEPSDDKSGLSSMDHEKDIKVELPSPQSNGNYIQSASATAVAAAVSVETENPIDYEIKFGRNIDPNMDPKKLRRIISNRISAQKSRTKKLQYIGDMEKKVKDLQGEVGMLSPQVAYEEQIFNQLKMENGILKQKIDAWTDRSNVSSVETEMIGAEIKRLKELQKMQKHDNARMFGLNSGMEQTSNLNLYHFGSHDSQPSMMGLIMNSSKDELDQILGFKSLTVDPPKSLI